MHTSGLCGRGGSYRRGSSSMKPGDETWFHGSCSCPPRHRARSPRHVPGPRLSAGRARSCSAEMGRQRDAVEGIGVGIVRPVVTVLVDGEALFDLFEAGVSRPAASGGVDQQPAVAGRRVQRVTDLLGPVPRASLRGSAAAAGIQAWCSFRLCRCPVMRRPGTGWVGQARRPCGRRAQIRARRSASMKSARIRWESSQSANRTLTLPPSCGTRIPASTSTLAAAWKCWGDA